LWLSLAHLGVRGGCFERGLVVWWKRVAVVIILTETVEVYLEIFGFCSSGTKEEEHK
jgi:hypothetical protein